MNSSLSPKKITQFNKKKSPLGWLADGTQLTDSRIISFPIIPHRNEVVETSTDILKNGYFYSSKKFSPIDTENTDRDWIELRNFWDNLCLDTYMADSGTYRWRRYSTHFFQNSGAILKMPHMPLFKSSEYNSFAGDIYRQYEETDNKIFFNPYFQRVLNESLRTFISCENQQGRIEQKWFIEVDQYRIIATNEQCGKPTPEGIHSDGTNYFTLMLVQREGISGGISSIYDSNIKLKKEVTLKHSGDIIMLDDSRMLHGVTDIKPTENSGFRDILHISFTNLLRPNSIRRRFGLGSENMLTI